MVIHTHTEYSLTLGLALTQSTDRYFLYFSHSLVFLTVYLSFPVQTHQRRFKKPARGRRYSKSDSGAGVVA